MSPKTERPKVGGWTSSSAEARYRAVEDVLWREECPVAPQALDVETSVGTTRAYRWRGAGEPVVLLHGMGGSAIQWARMVGDLGDLDVYGVDTMGDVGRSIHREPFRDMVHIAEWVGQTLDALGLATVHLVGFDYGAYVAMHFASRSPHRLASVTFIDPSMFARVSWGLLSFAAKIFLTMLLPKAVRRVAGRRLGMPNLEDRRALRITGLARRHHPFVLPFPRPVTDAELGAIHVPALILVGDRSAKYDPHDVVARLRSQMEDVEAVVVPGTHGLPIDPAAEVGRRVAEFVARHPISATG